MAQPSKSENPAARTFKSDRPHASIVCRVWLAGSNERLVLFHLAP